MNQLSYFICPFQDFSFLNFIFLTPFRYSPPPGASFISLCNEQTDMTYGPTDAKPPATLCQTVLGSVTPLCDSHLNPAGIRA
jgi:hypothetical protein